MADDFDTHDGLAVEQLSEDDLHKARKTIARNAIDRDDCANLLAMLGLVPSERKRGCRQCGGPLSIASLASANGYRGCCSTVCRDALEAVAP